MLSNVGKGVYLEQGASHKLQVARGEIVRVKVKQLPLRERYRKAFLFFSLLLFPVTLIVMGILLSSCQLLQNPFGAATATSTPAATAMARPTVRACALPGAAVEVDGFALQVNAVVRPANATLAMSDPRNPAPAAGNVYVLVQLSGTCRKGGGENCQIGRERFTLEGLTGARREPESAIVGGPNLLTASEFSGGSTFRGSIVFQVPRGEIGQTLHYQNSASGAEACLILPSWSTNVVVEYVPTPTPTPTLPPTPTPVTSPLATPTLAAPTATPTPTILLPAAGESRSGVLLAAVALLLLGGLAWYALRRQRLLD